MNLVFRYCREVRASALVLSLSSQNCRTAALTVDLTCSLEGLVVIQVRGGGRPYCKESSLIFQNQDLDEGLAEEKMLTACLARMFSPSLNLHTWPKRENILRCN